MPELPEVETARRTLDRVLTGHTVVEAEIAPDEIVLKGAEPESIRAAVEGARVVGTGRKGKYWWIELEGGPVLFGHLGMSGWIREIGAATIRLREHGQAPMDDESGRPKFLKLRLKTDEGREVVMTDGRRLSRIWLGDSVETDPKINELGPDCWTDLPDAKTLKKTLGRRKAPIKAVLLDQKVFAGVGNWIADEALYQARIAPARLANSLTQKEVSALREKLWTIVDKAVEVGADKEQFPENWMFHHRWGGKKGRPEIDGHEIVREPIGGRTTAWVPDLQR